ncbi:MAG: DsrE/DsrF/DrsH-like family protein [Bradymonadia bacterium]|jgi:NADPH-dependent 2,4-dienoyl-CoA reductase/sulfur reductase-like enzyme/peroxiredoxin family protein/TusA-related sulfurtransferase/rhodanese-related sulfurtransferase
MKVVIVGGVAGGAGAATRLRRMDEGAQIVLIERGEHVSYANCGLPYFLGGVISEREKLVVTPPQRLRERFNIDVRTRCEAIHFDSAKKKLTLKDLDTGNVYSETYDKLILSPGASPIRPKIFDKERVFCLRNVRDVFAIDDFIREHKPKTAAVVGAGFIGVEIAENLIDRGLSVKLIEAAKHVLPPFDPEMVEQLHVVALEHGLELKLGGMVTDCLQNRDTIQLKCEDGSSIEADFVVLSIGVRPDTQFAKDSGIQLSERGAILVDENFKTSAPDVYAVGDAIEVRSLVDNANTFIPLAGPANKQGRRVADVAANISRTLAPMQVQGASIVKFFEYTAACVGYSEGTLKRLGIAYQKVYAHPGSHAGYYPGAGSMHLKLLFDEKGKILGAQGVGTDGVDKRIDVISTTQRLGGSVYDLEELELCYAPPYNSAKDPVNMLGFIAGNVLRGEVKVFYPEDVEHLQKQGAQLVDVSTAEEFMLFSLPTAINLPLDSLRQNMAKLDKTRPVYITCRVGQRGYIATRILSQNGFEAYNLTGGCKSYACSIKGLKPVILNQTLCCSSEDEGQAYAMKLSEKTNTIELDACGLQCPGPILKVADALKELQDGQQLCVVATDAGFASDIGVWCERTGNTLIKIDKNEQKYEVLLAKGGASIAPRAEQASFHDKSIIVFSGDLDKAIASFIIASGAASMGRKVTMFFTFWGLNILRKPEKVKVKKNFIERAFGFMMPRGSKKLGLSRMNMGGMGAQMIRRVMASKNVQSLEELMDVAVEQGVNLVACQMSMDVMGIRREELRDDVSLGGVATFLGAAELSDTNLFI